MSLSDLDRTRLIEDALKMRHRAYAPYSHYLVGAALLATNGNIYLGCNVENAAYPTTICAERVAVFSAVADGVRQFEAIVVATINGGSPCGSCRQVLGEFGLQTLVICVDEQGSVTLESTVGGLLPGAFTPEHLVT
jgi:cytidine deaminase